MSAVVDDYLAVPGARTALPVSACRDGFSAGFVAGARECFDNVHYQLGGDHALYYSLRLSEFLPTAMEGELTLGEYVVHPSHRVQALLLAGG